MKKVLLIGYLWPYCRYQGGSPRTLGLVTYLSGFGWHPIVLTPPLSKEPSFLSKARIIETSYRDLFYLWKKIFQVFAINPNKSVTSQLKERMGVTSKKPLVDLLRNFYLAVFAFPDSEKHWRAFALKSADDVFSNQKMDAIVSVWPITSHLIARVLKQKYGIPWIADFTHLWSQGYDYQYGPLRKWFDERLELKTLREADALTTISPFFVKRLGELHRKQPIHSITHGYDPSTVNIPPVPLTAKFSITYTGSVYPDKQKPSKLFQALKELIDCEHADKEDIEVSFYGGRYGWLAKEFEQWGLSSIVHQYDGVPQSESIQKQRESQVLLHLGWDDNDIQGFYSSKIFEYLAARRPILGVGGASDQVVNDLLSETNAGVYSKNVKDIREFLKGFYLEYKREGLVIYKGNRDKINKYSHREMAKNFADILNQIVKGISPTN